MTETTKLNAQTFRDKFKRDEMENTHTTYSAIEIFFDNLRNKSSVTSDVIKNHEFLIDSGRKKAISLNFVTWKCESMYYLLYGFQNFHRNPSNC